jgi:hypothetical protein
VTFGFDLVLITRLSLVLEVEIYVPCLLTLRRLEGNFGKNSRCGGNFKK